METHRCRRGEEEKEEGVRNCEGMSLFIGRECLHRLYLPLMELKKHVF